MNKKYYNASGWAVYRNGEFELWCLERRYIISASMYSFDISMIIMGYKHTIVKINSSHGVKNNSTYRCKHGVGDLFNFPLAILFSELI